MSAMDDNSGSSEQVLEFDKCPQFWSMFESFDNHEMSLLSWDAGVHVLVHHQLLKRWTPKIWGLEVEI